MVEVEGGEPVEHHLQHLELEVLEVTEGQEGREKVRIIVRPLMEAQEFQQVHHRPYCMEAPLQGVRRVRQVPPSVRSEAVEEEDIPAEAEQEEVAEGMNAEEVEEVEG